MAPFKSLGTVSYSHFVATMAVSRAVCELFSIEEWLDLENWVGGCSRSLKITFIEVMNGYRVALFYGLLCITDEHYWEYTDDRKILQNKQVHLWSYS